MCACILIQMAYTQHELYKHRPTVVKIQKSQEFKNNVF